MLRSVLQDFVKGATYGAIVIYCWNSIDVYRSRCNQFHDEILLDDAGYHRCMSHRNLEAIRRNIARHQAWQALPFMERFKTPVPRSFAANFAPRSGLGIYD